MELSAAMQFDFCSSQVSGEVWSPLSEASEILGWTSIVERLLGLVHTMSSAAGRVAYTKFFQVFFRVRYWAPNARGSGTSGAPLL